MQLKNKIMETSHYLFIAQCLDPEPIIPKIISAASLDEAFKEFLSWLESLIDGTFNNSLDDYNYYAYKIQGTLLTDVTEKLKMED